MKKIICLLCIVYLMIPSLGAFTPEPDMSWTKKVGARQYPKGTKVFNVSDYGAIADGTTLNTKAIQKAIDACALSGGGTVTFEKGKYLSGSLYLKEGVNFEIPKGTILLGSTNIEDYPEIDTRVAGIEMHWPSALINVLDQKNVMLSGSGIVHAQGKVFWDTYWEMRKEYEAKGLRWIIDYDCKRPRTLLISNSEDITVKDLTFQQAGFWTIQLLYSSYCTVDGVVVQNNIGGHGPSTDGVDVDSSSYILIENCDIDCNDDNFCLKSGRDADGLRVNRPTEYVVIRNCLSRAGGGLITCGSETSGGIRYVLAEGLKAKGTNVAIRLKSAMNRGGTTEHIYIKDVELEDVNVVFEANVNWNPAYSYSTLPKEYENKPLPDHWVKMLEKVDAKKGTPSFRDVYVSDIKIKSSRKFLEISGNKDAYMQNFYFDNVQGDVEMLGNISFAKNIHFQNIDVRAGDNKPVSIENSNNINYPKDIVGNAPFAYQLNGKNSNTKIVLDKHPELAFYFPEMGGNLKFGITGTQANKWLSEFKDVSVQQSDKKSLVYTLSDPLLGKGKLVVTVISLSQSDGVIIEVNPVDIPQNLNLFWSYGGAYAKVLGENEHGRLKPIYCRNNIFSVEQTAFTLYHGESMRLKTVNAVMPVTSEIRLSDAHIQKSPQAFFESGKKTDSPALAATLPLISSQKEYFCIYKQNDKADYNHFMLPDLFKEESLKK
ncbi:glycosyl hydrolase family 28 [Dysgonomonas alginatilytica]|uniref:Glycosyl hydrolase family 28 n=1 Tax=Dysgonomonas alginatilytica TaxID=1605892 RepID=A0A2V3PQE0_9BACT|nr:DUF4450 domain-containing protein [Dysgonomonas alginatilytica]PXV65892.1 glycosyl hydrolase family 28 [Dysgonomonas alginatilytica]